MYIDGQKKDGRKKDGKRMCASAFKGTQNVRYAAQYRLGRCSFALTVSTAHCAALDQLPGMFLFAFIRF